MQSEIYWADVAAEFESDGALRDVYVLGTTEADWDAVFALVRRRHPPLRYFIDHVAAQVPEAAAQAFAVWPDAGPLLLFDVGGIQLACHFFTPEEIEFDLRPEGVDGPARLASLVDFLAALATASGKPALLTHENMPHAVILRVEPPVSTSAHNDAPGPL
jgi:hypothetical protein